ncbi:hypothetical protein Pmani_021402 [Petrolisthes manimaculis]|uniref:Uncharacterized protein n=1 Tax=Petrolisthes manimaculis TaxID=1843537 RepID=A0AAE1U5I1_9EUCA|nr:hypothetical protein Pmani_021402 [Petrolisthes manimaculis]
MQYLGGISQFWRKTALIPGKLGRRLAGRLHNGHSHISPRARIPSPSGPSHQCKWEGIAESQAHSCSSILLACAPPPAC